MKSLGIMMIWSAIAAILIYMLFGADGNLMQNNPMAVIGLGLIGGGIYQRQRKATTGCE